MSEYYAVQRSGDSLAHYGVKGMRWGVQKAKESGNERKLAKHYKKASKKLAKLQNKADVNFQKKKIANARSDQTALGASGAVNIGINAIRTNRSFAQAINTAKALGRKNYTASIYLPTGAAMAAGGIVAKQIAKNKAKKLISEKGHKEAVSNANQFRNEMKKAFSGTKYSNNIGGMAKDIAAKKRRGTENRYKWTNQGRAEAYATKVSSNKITPKHKKRR